jgi:hypothetical protein
MQRLQLVAVLADGENQRRHFPAIAMHRQFEPLGEKSSQATEVTASKATRTRLPTAPMPDCSANPA